MDIISDVKVPIQIGKTPKLPLRVLSAAHSTERRFEYFDLQVLAPFGGPLSHSMVAEFLRMISTKSVGTARTWLAGIRRQFDKIATGFDPSWSPDEWRQAFSLAAEATRNDTSVSAVTRNDYILDANRFAAFLQKRGVIPRFSLPIGVKNSFLSSKPKRAVSEVVVNPQRTEGTLALAGADEDAVQLWRHLSKVTNITDPAVMHERLTIILSHVRSIAVRGIRAHQAAHASAMAQVDKDEHARISRFLAENGGRSSRSLGSGRGSKSIFANNISVLSFIEYEYGGMPPTRFEAPAFARLVYNRFSVKDLNYSLFLTIESSIYYIIIILLDTAMNVSSALALSVNSSVRIEGSDYYKITWYKDRAGEEPIEDHFVDARTNPKDDSIGVVETMETLTALNGRLRDFSLPDERDSLFLIGGLKGPNGSRGKYRAGVLSQSLESKAWQRIRRRDPVLSEIPITLDMIRSSILLLECLETNNSLFAANRKAHHASYKTTVRYMQRASVNTNNVAYVRTIQNFITAKATENLEDIRKSIGMTQSEAARIIGSAKRKGFGSWAGIHDRQRPTTEAPDAGAVPEAVSAIEEWIGSGEKLLLADETMAAEMLAFRAYILAEQPTLQHTPSWTDTWAPLLIFINIAIEAFPSGLRMRGEELADEMELFYAELD